MNPQTRRARILGELGLGPLWRLRDRMPGSDAAESDDAEPSPPDATPSPPDPAEQTLRGIMRTHSHRPRSGASEGSRPRLPDDLATSDRRTVPEASDHATPVGQPATASRDVPYGEVGDDIASLDWDTLEARIHACRGCALCAERRQAVPGVGDRRADWLFVGEGPGAEEDRRGEPFVGPSGRLLDLMLGAIGLQRGDDVYIANAVKCRPPMNRTPQMAEISACRPFLARQIALLQPRLIVALGRPAVQTLIDENARIAALRGRVLEAFGVPVIVTYHPAYLLRNPLHKAAAWDDLCLARDTMRMLKQGGQSLSPVSTRNDRTQ